VVFVLAGSRVPMYVMRFQRTRKCESALSDWCRDCHSQSDSTDQVWEARSRKTGKSVLRISYETGPRATALKLEGKLLGPWVDEVARTCFDINVKSQVKK
jgi:hypothetical protein